MFFIKPMMTVFFKQKLNLSIFFPDKFHIKNLLLFLQIFFEDRTTAKVYKTAVVPFEEGIASYKTSKRSILEKKETNSFYFKIQRAICKIAYIPNSVNWNISCLINLIITIKISFDFVTKFEWWSITNQKITLLWELLLLLYFFLIYRNTD